MIIKQTDLSNGLRWSTTGSFSRRGATTVEMAIVLVPFIMFTFAVIEYGWFMMIQNLIENTARESCRRAVVNTDVNNNSENLSETSIREQAYKILDNKTLSKLDIQFYRTDSAGGQLEGDWTTATYQQGVLVEIKGAYHPLFLGWAFKKGIPVSSKSVMNSEGQ